MLKRNDQYFLQELKDRQGITIQSINNIRRVQKDKIKSLWIKIRLLNGIPLDGCATMISDKEKANYYNWVWEVGTLLFNKIQDMYPELNLNLEYCYKEFNKKSFEELLSYYFFKEPVENEMVDVIPFMKRGYEATSDLIITFADGTLKELANNFREITASGINPNNSIVNNFFNCFGINQKVISGEKGIEYQNPNGPRLFLNFSAAYGLNPVDLFNFMLVYKDGKTRVFNANLNGEFVEMEGYTLKDRQSSLKQECLQRTKGI